MTSMRFLLLLLLLFFYDVVAADAAVAGDEATENGHHGFEIEDVPKQQQQQQLRGGGGGGGLVTAEDTSGVPERERKLSQSSWSSTSTSTSSSSSSSGGGTSTSTSWTSARPRRCPTLKCADPCPPGTCRSDQKCLTKKSYFFPDGMRCPGCPVFRRCARKTLVPPPPPPPQPRPAPVPTNVIGVCPVPPCQLPCGLCQMGEECKTKPTYFTGPNGQKCPGCPAFVGCVPIAPPPPQPCGKVTCSSGTVCCNASCGICTKPDMACIQLACIDTDEGGPKCGQVTCPIGDVCCNDSCSICTPPNGACTQQLCF